PVPDVLLPSSLGKFNLALPFTEPRPVFVGLFFVTTRAAHAIFESAGGFDLLGNWPTAGHAKLKTPGAKSVVHGNSMIEYEAFSFPETLLLWNLFQVLQDAPFEVVDFLESLGQHERGGLFAA